MRHILIPLLVCAPHVAQAERLGTITANVDGTGMTWFISAEDGKSRTRVAKITGIRGYHVSLWGNPTEGALAELKGAFLLDFTVSGASAGGPRAVGASVQFFEEGYAGAWVALDQGKTQVSLTAFDVGDDGVRVAGTFSAQAAFTDDIATMTTDPARTMEIIGQFEATLPVQ